MPVVINDRYELIGALPLGRGNFGEVWRAHDQNLDRIVALKLFFPNTMPTDVRRALAYEEAQFLESLKSPNVLPVLDADTDKARDMPYIAMELALEGSAEDQLSSFPLGLRPSLVCGWLRGVLVGLQGCHDARVLHGDIKPANVFLQRRDSALLGDLGMARLMDPQNQAKPAGDMLVQPPESFLRGTVDARSDIYGVGVTLYRLLTGSWPFFDTDTARLQALIVAGRPARVRDLAPHVPRTVALLVEKAMSPDPGSRFADAQTMHNALVSAGVFKRHWQPMVHAGHLSCWEELGASAPYSVCVSSAIRGRDIEVRHGGAGRVTRLKASALQASAAVVHLRRVFDDLGC